MDVMSLGDIGKHKRSQLEEQFDLWYLPKEQSQ